MRRQQFQHVILQALEGLPDEFRNAIDNLDIEVRWRPTASDLRKARLHRGHLLFGLYLGIPLPQRSHHYTMTLPDKIIIYQEPHERFCPTEKEMVEQTRKTLLHEIGHYLGIEEGKLRELGLG